MATNPKTMSLPPLVTIRQLAEHCHRSYWTVAKWSSGHAPSPYPEPVRGNNGRVIGWRREDIEHADALNRMSREQYLYKEGSR